MIDWVGRFIWSRWEAEIDFNRIHATLAYVEEIIKNMLGPPQKMSTFKSVTIDRPSEA